MNEPRNSTQLLLPTGLPVTPLSAQTAQASLKEKRKTNLEINQHDLITALAQLQDAIYQFKKAGGQWREPNLRGDAMTMACRVPGHKVFIDDSGNFTFDGVSVMAPRSE